MAELLQKALSILFLILTFLLFILKIEYDIFDSQANVVVSILILVLSLFLFRSRSGLVATPTSYMIRKKNMDLIGSLFSMLTFILLSSSNFWDFMTVAIGAISMIILWFTHRITTFQIDNNGISDEQGKLILDGSIVSNMTITKQSIALDTSNYKNDLKIESKNLHSPSFESLAGELALHYKKWKADQDSNPN